VVDLGFVTDPVHSSAICQVEMACVQRRLTIEATISL
jgi:hypothetical protein